VVPSFPLKGPKKAMQLPLLLPMARQGFRLFDCRLQELFDTADILSEGARKGNREASESENSYFGTTNILLTPYAPGFAQLGVDNSTLVRIFAWDPHVRLRALRIACREARVRAQGTIDQVRTEIVVSDGLPGIRIHVDLEARVVSTFPGSVETAECHSTSALTQAGRMVRRVK
jgi:hypothetical protein